MIANTAAADWVDDRLENFIRQALARGYQQFLATGPASHVRISIAGRSVGIAESAPFLAPGIQHCLTADQGDLKNDAEFSVFIDYSGWHLALGNQGVLSATDNQPAVERRLARIGVRAVFGDGMQVCDLFDPVLRFGLRLQAGTKATAPWEPTAPLANFCKWIAATDGKTMVHAASLAQGDVGALLVGHGGAGKSGTVVGGLMTGFQSAGDDYTLIDRLGGYRAHAVYRTVKQDLRGLDRLGLPRQSALNWQNKAVFRPESLGANQIVDSAPITVLLVPVTKATTTHFSPFDPAEAFKILSISTLKQIGGGMSDVFQACAAIVRDLPCYAMALSPDKDEVAAKLSGFLRSLPC